MFEPRLAPSFFPTQEELAKKDQVIQSLTESQRSLNKQNQTLLSKIDELEFQVSHLKELHEKVDQVTDHQDRERSTSGGSTCPQDLEKQVTEVTAQRDALLQRYKHLVDVNQQVMKRDEQIETALRALLKRHGKELQSAVRTELKTIRDLLCDLEQDIRDKVDGVLSVLGPQDSQRAKQVPMDKDMASALERIVDLIGPEYGKLGKRLGLGQKELERVESARETFAEKTRLVLRSWLCARGGASQSPAQELTAALRDIDKDVNLLKQTPISGPERQALRNCLQYAVDHVTDPLNVLDHLIVLNDLTPGGWHSPSNVQLTLTSPGNSLGLINSNPQSF
nr:hypothetical protein BaRGS_015311 [Batillaria attramentaria]